MLHKRPNMYKFLNVEDTYILDTDTDNRKQKLGIEKKYRCAAYSTLSVRGAALHLSLVVLRMGTGGALACSAATPVARVSTVLMSIGPV